MNMNARKGKQVLRQVWHTNAVIDSLYDQIAQCRAMGTKVTASCSGTPGGSSGTGSRVEASALSLVELESKLDREIDALSHLKIRCAESIGELSDMRERGILELRYMCHPRRSWASIMTRLEISERRSYQLHESALAHFWLIYQSKK